ncbi:MAG: hypothetical protein VKK59_01650, partial [Vampirovibrionales bacterium]|nr:hypothetical protein [Vampirovibrionales bacterium]
TRFSPESPPIEALRRVANRRKRLSLLIKMGAPDFLVRAERENVRKAVEACKTPKSQHLKLDKPPQAVEPQAKWTQQTPRPLTPLGKAYLGQLIESPQRRVPFPVSACLLRHRLRAFAAAPSAKVEISCLRMGDQVFFPTPIVRLPGGVTDTDLFRNGTVIFDLTHPWHGRFRIELPVSLPSIQKGSIEMSLPQAPRVSATMPLENLPEALKAYLLARGQEAVTSVRRLASQSARQLGLARQSGE